LVILGFSFYIQFEKLNSGNSAMPPSPLAIVRIRLKTRPIHAVLFAILLLTACSSLRAPAPDAPPFPEALDDAAVHVDRLDDLLDFALILGNGDITALLFTEDGRLTLRLTKNDIWDARVDTRRDPPLPTIELIERLAAEAAPVHRSAYVGDTAALESGWGREGRDAYGGHPYPCPRPCGKIVFGDPATSPPAAAIAATLQLRRAAIRLDRGGDTQQGVARALAGRNVFLLQWPEPAAIVNTPSADTPDPSMHLDGDVQWLHQVLPGDGDYPGMEFTVALASRGDLHAVAIVTSRDADDCRVEAVRLARQTLADDQSRLVAEHEAIWNTFWSASGVRLDDPFLSRVWYRNLYFLRSIVRPGVVAPGLYAGLTSSRPAWHGDYHTNYNEQSTFWSAFVTNHPELTEPYDRLIRDYLVRAQWIAKKIFSLDGAYYPLNLFAYEPPDPETSVMPNNRQYIHHVWSFTQGVNAFAAQPLWWRYKYAPDRAFLENTAYPVVREVAIFQSQFLDRCARDADGRAVVAPTISPEHWGWTKDLERNRNCTFDIAMFRYLFDAAIEGARTLDRDADWVERWRRSIGLLPPYPTTAGPQPIVVDVQDAPPTTYNIAVPATPVFPGDVVTRLSPPEERELFRRTIDAVRWNGTNSLFMLGVSRARLAMPDTFDFLRDEMQLRARPNGTLMLNRPGHRVNGFGHYTEQFAAPMAVSELMLQSVGDVLRVFPAWPAERDAAFENLRAQGGFLVSARHAGGRVQKIEIVATVGGPLRLAAPWPAVALRSRFFGSKTLTPDRNGIIQLETAPGQRLTFLPR
jgi:hypothetical protein